MSKVMQKLQQGIVLGLMVGAIAACQSATTTTEEPANTPATEPATEPAEVTESVPSSSAPATTSDAKTAPATVASSADPSAEPKAPTPKPIPDLPAECANPETQTAMNTCAQSEYDQADVRLNNTYQAVKATVSGEKVNQLVEAEEAWITYRDLYCDFVQSQFAGGSMQPLVYHSCMTQLTQNRTALLDQTAPSPLSFAAADQDLNTVYQDLQTILSPQEQDQLIDAQLAWIDYRDVHCVFEGGDTSVCMATVTVFQTQHLQAQIASRSL